VIVSDRISAQGGGYFDRVRLITACGILTFGFVWLGGGCSGGEESDGVVVAAGDLPSIVAVRPTTVGWHWPRRRSGSLVVRRDELGTADTNALQASLSRELGDAGFVRLDVSRWSNLEIGSEVSATLFETSSGARSSPPASSSSSSICRCSASSGSSPRTSSMKRSASARRMNVSIASPERVIEA
jgi:hypothetical protein